MTQVPTWLLGIHEALQVIWSWSHQDAPALILWRLLLASLLSWGLILALAYGQVTTDAPHPRWPSPLLWLLNFWSLAAALFPALLGLSPVIPQQLRGTFRVSLLALIVVVTLYGQARSKAEQRSEQRRQLLAFADRAADLFRAEGDRLLAEIEQRALQEAIAAEESRSEEADQSDEAL